MNEKRNLRDKTERQVVRQIQTVSSKIRTVKGKSERKSLKKYRIITCQVLGSIPSFGLGQNPLW